MTVVKQKVALMLLVQACPHRRNYNTVSRKCNYNFHSKIQDDTWKVSFLTAHCGTILASVYQQTLMIQRLMALLGQLVLHHSAVICYRHLSHGSFDAKKYAN